MKNLKPLLLPFGLIVLVVGIFSFTNPLEKSEDKTCSIKIVKIINGVKTEIDSTFNCDESMAWVTSIKGVEGSLKEALNSLMIKGESGEGSFSFNMDFEEDEEDGVKIMKFKAGDDKEEVEMDFEFKDLEKGKDGVMKMTINGETIEINVGDIEKQVEHMGIDINVEEVTEDENGKEIKKVIIISNVVTNEKKDKKALSKNRTKEKELTVEELKFGPNPNEGKFDLSFELNKKKPVTIKIIDMNGKEVYTETVTNFEGKYFKNIDISENKEGVYILQITQGNKVKTSKIMIK